MKTCSVFFAWAFFAAAVPATAQTPAVDAFAPLLGSCFTARFANSDAVNTQCFERLYGSFVRNRHAVYAPDLVYEGETIFHGDASGSVIFRYYNRLGGVSDGRGEWRPEAGVLMVEQTHVAADGQVSLFRGRYHDLSEEGFSAVNERYQNGEWVVASSLRYVRAGQAPATVDVPAMKAAGQEK